MSGGAWSRMEQLLTCAICLDRFRNPKLLPCQHTFCGEPCMEGLVDYKRQIKCPECRAEHRLPYNGVQSFPNNVTIVRFLELHRSITGEEPEPLPSQMDRCSVCGEKSLCNRCAHCEKKVCDECRQTHLDILRREINRLNVQIRRDLEKLNEHTQQADKGSDRLIQIVQQIKDEIVESVRRLVKDLKDKESKLLEELEEFSVSECKNTNKLKEDFEIELATITSNCELAEEHITDVDEWTDIELMEYKEIFMKTLDFLRNLEPDSLLDFNRKIKYIQKVDLDQMRRSAADFGEIKIIQPATQFGSSPISPSESTNNLSLPQSSLMRSQSDHRLAQAFNTGLSSRSQLQRSFLDVTGSNRYGSDSERERGSSPPGRRGDGNVRFGSVHERSRYNNDSSTFGYTRGWPRPGDSDYEPSNSANFRSRFMRERIRERTGGANSGANSDDHSFDEHESDTSPGHRSVRFQEEQSQSPSRNKLIDTDEMNNLRTPLSGLFKLIDSPHVMERLHQNEIKAKQKADEAEKTPVETPVVPKPIVSQPIHRPAQRQISEDEIEKQKKQNQAAFSQQQQQQQQTTTTTTIAQPQQTAQPTPTSQSVVTTATNRRIQTLQKEDGNTGKRRSPSIDSADDTSLNYDDDDLSTTTTTTTAATTNNSVTRRRIYASTHSGSGSASTGGTTTTPTTTSSFGQSIDYGNSRYTSSSNNNIISNNNNNNNNSNNSNSNSNSNSSYYSQQYTPSSYLPQSSTVDSSYTYRNRSKTAISRTELNRLENNNNNSNTDLSNYTGLQRRNSVNKNRHHHHHNQNHHHNSLSSQNSNNNADDSEQDINNIKNKTSERYGSSSYLMRHKLAKSRSSHTVAYDDSDDDCISSTTGIVTGYGFSGSSNPLSPTSSGLRSRFATATITSGSSNNNISTITDTTTSSDRYTRRSSRSSAYSYRTRETSPEEESAGSVTQYLINKYGTKPTGSALSKSKSSHVIFGRSLSSSDEDTSPITTTKYRRDSNNETSTYSTASSFKSSVVGLTSYPRQMYLQKRKLIMKIGSRGTNPSCFTWPRGVSCSPDNSIVVADSSNHRIQVFDSTGRFQFEFGSYGNHDGEFDCLAGVTVNRLGHFIVSDRYNHRVQIFDANGRFLRSFGSEGRSDGKFSYPWGIATDALGFIYVCDKENHRIQVFQSDGTFAGKFGSIGGRSGQLEHPHYIAVSNTNRIIVSDCNNHRIQIFDINGRSLSTFGSEGSGDGQFKFPRGVAVDDNGFVIVGDSGNNRIQIFNPDGTFLKTFGQWGSGEGEFKGLEDVAISSTGNILVCDRENHRIQVF